MKKYYSCNSMFDESVKAKFSNLKFHEKILKSIIDDNNKIRKQAIYIIRFSNEFCVTICKEFLFWNFAWFGRRMSCKCLDDDSRFIEILF